MVDLNAVDDTIADLVNQARAAQAAEVSGALVSNRPPVERTSVAPSAAWSTDVPLAAERAVYGDMRSQPSATGVQMVDLNALEAPTSPAESSNYQAQQRPLEQQSRPRGGHEAKVHAQRMSVAGATRTMGENLFQRRAQASIEQAAADRALEAAQATERLKSVPSMVNALVDAGYGTKPQLDQFGQIQAIGSVDPDLMAMVQDYAKTGRRPQRMKQDVADLLGITGTADEIYTGDMLPSELAAGVEAGVNLEKAKPENNIGQYNAIRKWPKAIKEQLFEPGLETLRLRPDAALQLVVSQPELFALDDVKAVSNLLNSTKGNWKTARRNLVQQLKSTSDPGEQQVLRTQLSELMGIPVAQRDYYGLDVNSSPEAAGALDRITGTAVQEIFSNDPNATSARYILSGGEMQELNKKGQGFTGDEETLDGQGFAVTTDDDGNVTLRLKRNVPASKRNASDLEAILRVDGKVGTAKELGLMPGVIEGGPEAVALASGLGDRASNVVGFEPRRNVSRFTELQGTNASGDLDEELVNPEMQFAVGSESYTNSDLSTRLSDDEAYSPGREQFDPSLMFATGMESYGTPSVSPAQDFAGRYVGGVRGFYETQAPKRYETKEAGVDLAPIYTSPDEAELAGVIRNPYGKGWRPYPSTKLFYADAETLANADTTPNDRRAGFMPDGTPRSDASLKRMTAAGVSPKGRMAADVRLLSERYNEAAAPLNRMIARGELETLTPLTGVGGLGPDFPGVVRDYLQNPATIRKLFAESGDPELASIPLPVEIKDGEVRELGLIRSFSGSEGMDYDKPVAVQQPNALVNDGLSLLLAKINKDNGGMTARDRERLSGIPRRTVKIPDKNGEMKWTTLSPELSPGTMIQEVNNDIAVAPAKGAMRKVESDLDELLAIINQDGPVTSKQQDRLQALGDSISDSVQYIPEDEGYNPDAAQMSMLRPADGATPEMVQNYDEAVRDSQEGYRPGFFPIKGTLSDAKDYNIAVPKGGSEDTYEYQQGKTINNPRLWAGVQLAQLEAQRELGKTRPARIPGLDTAIAASKTRNYRYAGQNPIEVRARMIAATVPQISDAGYRMQLTRPSDYTGSDSRDVVSNYGVDDANRLAAQVRGMRAGLEPTDPKYGQLVELESSVLQDAANAKPPGPGPVDTRVRVETDPDYAAAIYKDLEPRVLPRRLGVKGPENIGAQEGVLKGAQLTALGQELIDQAKSKRGSRTSSTAATERPTRLAVLQAAPAQGYSSVSPDGASAISAYNGDIGERVSGDPASNIKLTPRQVRGIQNPGGKYSSEVKSIGAQLEANREALKAVALQSPIDQYQVRTSSYNVGGNKMLGGPVNLLTGAASNATGEMAMTGMEPNRVLRTMENLMSQARTENKMDASNRQKLNAMRPAQQELLSSIPQTRSYNPGFRMTPEEQDMLAQMNAREYRRGLFEPSTKYPSGIPSAGQLSLDL
jgi:hypothetical protein